MKIHEASLREEILPPPLGQPQVAAGCIRPSDYRATPLAIAGRAYFEPRGESAWCAGHSLRVAGTPPAIECSRALALLLALQVCASVVAPLYIGMDSAALYATDFNAIGCFFAKFSFDR